MSPDGQPSDAELIALYVRERSESAFGQLVARHINLVYAAAVRQLRDPQSAQDVTQDVFVLLARRCGEMDGRIVLPAWLYKAAVLAARNALKAAARRRHREMAAQSDRPRRDSGDVDSSAFEDVLPLLDEAIGTLGERDRAALVLRYFKGQSVGDVGAALGISANATSKRLERAVAKLRTFFARRNVSIGAAAIASGLAAHGAQAAPPGLAAIVTCGALKATTGAAAAGSGAIVKGTAILMASGNVKSVVAAAVALLLLVGGVVGLIVYGNSGGEPTRGGQPVAANGPAPTVPVVAAPASPAPPPPANDVPDYIPGGRMPKLSTARVPRKLFSTIQAEHADAYSGVIVLAPGLTSLGEGDWALYSKVDFGLGATMFVTRLACPNDRAGGRINVRVDAVDGAVIASLPVRGTGGATDRAAQTAPLGAPVAGIHDVYLTFSGGDNVADLDWFKFTAGPRDARARIEAEGYDYAAGVNDQGTFLSNLDRPDYVLYASLDFGEEGPKWFQAKCGVNRQYAGSSILVRLDGVRGEVIADLVVEDTGAFTTHRVQRAAVAEVKGVHDVYLTFTGNACADLDWFVFSDELELPAELPRID